MTSRRALAAALLFLGALPLVQQAEAQSPSRFGIEAARGGGAVVRVAALLNDRGLQNALESGLPLRFRLRVELWRKALFDQLTDAVEINLALIYDPLDRDYRLDDGRREVRHTSLASALGGLEESFRTGVRPERSGRYYYLGTLEVETLSLSDLDELRRWLRGEVQPAVEGRGSASRAVESGLGRLFVRVIGLPSRKYEDRSATFVIP